MFPIVTISSSCAAPSPSSTSSRVHSTTTDVTTPPSSGLPTPDSARPKLTSETLRPLNKHDSARSAPSIASSSEAHDLVGPLPPSRPTMHERRQSRSRISDLPPLPLPSPPAMGLSELMSGSPHTPGNEDSYFSTARISATRRPSTRPSSDKASSFRSDGSTSGARKSPQVQNQGVLAPHGSFTTSRPRLVSQEQVVSDSQLYLGNMRSSLPDEPRRAALEQAAQKGDQLAMYRLGWRGGAVTGQRHHLGSIDAVWGPTSP